MTSIEPQTEPQNASSALRSPHRGWIIARPVVIACGYLIAYLLFDVLSAALRPVLGADGAVLLWYAPPVLSLLLPIIFGVRYGPIILLGPLAVGLLHGHWGIAGVQDDPTVFSDWLGFALAAAAVYTLIGFICKESLKIDTRLMRVRDAFYFLLFALMAPFLTELLGQVWRVLLHHQAWSHVVATVSDRWNGQVDAVLTLAPLILALVVPWVASLAPKQVGLRHRVSARRIWLAILEIAGWLLGLGGVLWITLDSPVVQEFHPLYLAFLFLVWAAIRHGIRGAAAGIAGVIIGMLAIIGDLGLHNFTAMEIQIFTLSFAITGILLGAMVSEQRLSEEVIREREELLQTLINAMPDVVIFKDGEGRWLEANSFGLNLYQLTGTDFRGKRNLEQAITHENYRKALVSCDLTDQLAWEAHEDTRGEENLTQPDGTRLTLDVIKVPLFDPDGARKGLLVIGRDISERKRAEELLEKERAYLSSAIDILPIPLAFRAVDGEWTHVNNASHTFFKGLPPHDWTKCFLLTPDSHTPLPSESWPVLRALQGEVLTSVELILELPDGTETAVLAHAAPIYVSGKMVAAVAAFQDISALKEADKAKDQFLGVLSHELLTPLTNVLGWTHAASESPEMTGQALEIIERNIRRQHQILTDLLDLSRITNRRLQLDCTTFDLSILLEECVAAHDQMATERRRSLLLNPIEEPVIINGSQERIRQIIESLFTRALKSTGPGDSITVSLGVQGAMAVLTIRDTGRGIDPTALPQVFNPFQTAERAEASGGDGLQLALVKGLVELHGGHISVFSPGVGYGTVFNVEFPIDESAGDAIILPENWESVLPE